MKIQLSIVVVLVLSFSLMANAQVFLAGVQDNFVLPVEAATPSQELVDLLIASQGPKDFDEMAINASAAHTFVNLPSNITDATLEFAVRAISDTTESDGIFLSFVNTKTTDLLDAIVYVRTFGGFGGSINPPFIAPDPGLVQGNSWRPGDEAIVTLDLSALPLADGGTLDLLSQLNSNGYLDVVVTDDSAADFMKLTVVHEPLAGDANRDGVVSAADYAAIQAYFGQTGDPGMPGDANGDGVVSAGDYASVQANFGNTAPTMTIPEPATMSLLVLGGVGILRKRGQILCAYPHWRDWLVLVGINNGS
jgi:hypothetical protein